MFNRMTACCVTTAAALLLGGCGEPSEAKLKNYEGMNAKDALAEVDEQGFDNVTTPGFGVLGGGYANYYVCKTRPAPGKVIPTDTEVQLRVAKGDDCKKAKPLEVDDAKSIGQSVKYSGWDGEYLPEFTLLGAARSKGHGHNPFRT